MNAPKHPPVGAVHAHGGSDWRTTHEPRRREDTDLSATELARRSDVTPQSMSSALGGLQQRVLVVRGPHPTHGRVVQFSVTEDGRCLAARGQQMVAGVNARALALLDPDARQRLHGLLLTLAGGLGLPVEHEQLMSK